MKIDIFVNLGYRSGHTRSRPGERPAQAGGAALLMDAHRALGGPMASPTRLPVFDADNHMYEQPDAFTRYLPTSTRT